MKFMPYQTSWVNDPSRLKIFVKSRRIGGTFSTGYETFRRLMTVKNHTITVITRDMLTAGEYVRDVTKWVEAWNSTCKPSERIPMKGVLKGSIEIPHKGGPSRLLALSSNPDAAAGKGGDLVIDEMAIHKDQQLLVTVAKPIITAGGRLSVISTHRSKSSLFNQYVNDAMNPDNAWSLHRTTMVDAVDAGFVELVVNPLRRKMGEAEMSREEYLFDLQYNIINDDAIWDQEYMCIPSEQQYTLLPMDLITKCIQRDENEFQGHYKPGMSKDHYLRYLGWDIAESEQGDFSVMFVVEKIGEYIRVVDYIYIPKGTEFPEQKEILDGLVKKYKVHKMAIDSTGLGREPAGWARRKYGEHMVEEVSFNQKTKEEIASKMLSKFQSETIRIPNDEQIITDLNSIEKIYTAAGNVTYHAPRINGSHGDGFWAMGLAVRAVPDHIVTELRTIGGKEASTAPIFNDRQARNRQKDAPRKGKLCI